MSELSKTKWKVMNDPFDELAKSLARSVKRRGTLKKFGIGVASLALASLFAAQAHAADLYADASVAANGDGTAARPYWRITEAVDRARALRRTGAIPLTERIFIHVAPGTYLGSKEKSVLNQNARYERLPILLNVPKVTLGGATVLAKDIFGLPIAAIPGTESFLKTVDHLGSWEGDSLILISRTTDGGVGDDVTVSGLCLDQPDKAHFSPNILVDRVRGFLLQGNVSAHGFGAITTQQASGTVEGNLAFDDPGPGIGFFSGGGSALPVRIEFIGNRALDCEGGVMLCAVAGRWEPHAGANDLKIVSQQATLDPNELTNTLVATVVGNDFSHNESFGIRFVCLPIHESGGGAVHLDPKEGMHGVMVASVLDNLVNHNGHYGISVDSAFALRSNKRPDSFSFAGTLGGNELVGNGRAGLLFAYTTIWVEVDDLPLDKDNDTLSFFKYLQNSTYAVTVLDDEAAGFDYDNPATDPLDGTFLNNTLIVNRAVIPQGRKISPLAP